MQPNLVCKFYLKNILDSKYIFAIRFILAWKKFCGKNVDTKIDYGSKSFSF